LPSNKLPAARCLAPRRRLPPAAAPPPPLPLTGFTVDAAPPGDLGAALVGSQLLYCWPDDGWQRGTRAVARAARSRTWRRTRARRRRCAARRDRGQGRPEAPGPGPGRALIGSPSRRLRGGRGAGMEWEACLGAVRCSLEIGFYSVKECPLE
jgi:hypothetical protein